MVGGHELGPLVSGQLDGGNGGDDLGGGVAGLGVGGGEGLEGQLLDAVLGFIVCLLEPLGLELLVTGEISGCEGVLEGDTGGGTDGTLSLLVGEFLDEGREVERLYRRAVSM
ncbi:hypothetical protein NLG97_g9059 [Lecanicillium saksenae]|uniref:Uncharacterized protein n=1 Tax=Lecanicillium saksenae TaxID=468837 RepID=A0ACC1QH35_9HYPO|nr:hypothetical protein NLG97_g9059 [Lecanicillium saksenae]